MKYVLDTCFLIDYLRGADIENQLPFDSVNQTKENDFIISIVTYAELLSLSKKLNWGERKTSRLKSILDDLIIVDITKQNASILNAYRDIEFFLTDTKSKTSVHFTDKSDKKIGKNDLWIAATTHVLDATLITSDKDYFPLITGYLKLFFYVKPQTQQSLVFEIPNYYKL